MSSSSVTDDLSGINFHCALFCDLVKVRNINSSWWAAKAIVNKTEDVTKDFFPSYLFLKFEFVADLGKNYLLFVFCKTG